MEEDFQITIKGLPEERTNGIGNAIIATVHAFEQVDKTLDFRRMHRVVVTTDFAGELGELSGSTVSKGPIMHTDEEYAVAVAKVLILPRGKQYEILPVLDARIATVLLPESPEGYNSENYRMVLHLFHHELCHVHDDNKKLDAFPTLMFHQCYEGKDIFIRPLAEVCWSEYIANFLSSSTVDGGSLAAKTESFVDAIKRTKPDVDNEILSYRYHGDLNHLLSAFSRHGEFLVKTAAYTLGYMDGLERPLTDLSADAAACLAGSYFEPTWDAMHKALQEMRRLYPNGWKDLSIYDSLAVAIENYYAEMGLVLDHD